MHQFAPEATNETNLFHAASSSEPAEASEINCLTLLRCSGIDGQNDIAPFKTEQNAKYTTIKAQKITANVSIRLLVLKLSLGILFESSAAGF